MFRLLHKVYIGMRWLAVLGLAVLVYGHRSFFNPLVDLVDALRVREGLEQQKSGELSGTVTRVLSGDIFQVRDERGRIYTIRLTGVEAPEFQLTSPAARSRANASRAQLSQLVLSREVRIELTHTNDSRHALGLVYLGGTNVNVMAVENGIVRAKPENMHGLPLKDRYALIQAERRARDRNLVADE
jgi:endonuclease YncB( thermonuclease family)